MLFESLWEEEHNGKQISIAKKRELRNTALKWFCLGTAHGKEMLKKEVADIITRKSSRKIKIFFKNYLTNNFISVRM